MVACSCALFEYLTAGLDSALAVHERVLLALREGAATPRAPAAPVAGTADADGRPGAWSAEGGVGVGVSVGVGVGDGCEVRLLGLGSRQHEILLEEQLWLLRLRHSTLGAQPPAGRERTVMHAMLTDFPANPHMLTALVSRRGGSSFEGRRMLAAACRRYPQCAPLWMAAVRFEQAASTTHATPVDVAPPKDGVRAAAPISAPISAADEAGVERRVRIVLERALHSAACGGCAALWREYLRHELRMGRQEAVGRVHLRAVQQCPGVKGMWTQGLQLPLAALLPAQQLLDILQLSAMAHAHAHAPCAFACARAAPPAHTHALLNNPIAHPRIVQRGVVSGPVRYPDLSQCPTRRFGCVRSSPLASSPSPRYQPWPCGPLPTRPQIAPRTAPTSGTGAHAVGTPTASRQLAPARSTAAVTRATAHRAQVQAQAGRARVRPRCSLDDRRGTRSETESVARASRTDLELLT